MNPTHTIRAWTIGGDGTEIYAAYNEQEMREYYTQLVGEEEAARDLAENFTEIPQEHMDKPLRIHNYDTGKHETTTYRKLAEQTRLPAQILTSYN